MERQWRHRPISNAADSSVRLGGPLVRANPSVRGSAHFLSFDALLGTYNSSRSQVTIESAWGSFCPGAPATFASGESFSTCPTPLSSFFFSFGGKYLHAFSNWCFHVFLLFSFLPACRPVADSSSHLTFCSLLRASPSLFSFAATLDDFWRQLTAGRLMCRSELFAGFFFRGKTRKTDRLAVLLLLQCATDVSFFYSLDWPPVAPFLELSQQRSRNSGHFIV